MNYTFLCEARDSNDLLLEHNVCISNMPIVPRLGDKISLLEFPDRAWIGDEYSQWGIVKEVFYNVIGFNGIYIRLKAEQSDSLKS